MDIEEEVGFRSSFNFVPERYHVPEAIRTEIVHRAFEIGLHGLNHDGRLYRSRKEFLARAARLNQYAREWGVVGFRSPAMHHNLEWLLDLDIEYDASTFDTDPFQPQPVGVKTVFPFRVASTASQRGYVELPCTLDQDFTLFILMREQTIDTWKQKLEWIVEQGGMVLVNTHPDYMNFNGRRNGAEQYPVQRYRELLAHLATSYKGAYWHALPRAVARFVAGLSVPAVFPSRDIACEGERHAA
jgi:hypothetical protein